MSDSPYKYDPNHDPNRIIDGLGGTGAVAALCEIEPPSVSGWRRKQIPKGFYKFFLAIRPELFAEVSPPASSNSDANSLAAPVAAI